MGSQVVTSQDYRSSTEGKIPTDKPVGTDIMSGRKLAFALRTQTEGQQMYNENIKRFQLGY